jgi:hypothetical protein
MKTYWETPTSNLFDTANWSGGATPGVNDIVALTIAGTYTVTSNTNHTVMGLTTGKTATLTIGHDSIFAATEGTATGANVGTITIQDGSTLQIGGTVDNAGLINLDASGTSTQLLALSNTTFEGGGRIQMTDNVNNFFGIAANLRITNVNNTISGAGTILTQLFNNDKLGVIDATGSNNQLVFNSEVTNSGLIEATGAAGLSVGSSIDNQGGIIQAAVGSVVDLTGFSEIQGGTLKGNISVSGTATTLDGSSDGTLSNQSTVAIENGASLLLRGVIDNTGSLDLDGSASATSINLIGPALIGPSTSTVTLEGVGQVNLSDSSLNSLDAEFSNITLNNVNNTISGAGTIGASGDLTLNNEALGIINATGTTNQLILNASVKNAGRMEATGAAGLTIDTTVVNTASTQARSSRWNLAPSTAEH